jgi:hypothetical protein
MSAWLFPENPGDYSTDNFLWVDPLTVMDDLGLDPENPDDVALATELVAEASMILDSYTGMMYGPARCVAATYRLRGFPLLNFAPPIGTVHAVIQHHDKCLPPDDVYLPDVSNDELLNPIAVRRAQIMQIAQQGNLVGTPTGVIPSGGGTSAGVSYCVDTPQVMRICGIPRGGAMLTACGSACAGSELVTVLYKSRGNWPPGLSRIFMALLEGLQPDADGECAVPAGTTSVTRQGVTWSTELTEGLIGIPQVDEWIFRNRRKIRLKDPMHAQKVYSRFYDCEAIEPFTVQPVSVFGAEFGGTEPEPVLVDPLGRSMR